MGLAVAVGRRPMQRSGLSRSSLCAGKRPTAAEPRAPDTTGTARREEKKEILGDHVVISDQIQTRAERGRRTTLELER